jgi:hypothetical protein
LSARFSISNQYLLDSIGRSRDDPMLRLAGDGPPSSALQEILSTEAYARHKALADAIYAGEVRDQAGAFFS